MLARLTHECVACYKLLMSTGQVLAGTHQYVIHRTPWIVFREEASLFLPVRVVFRAELGRMQNAARGGRTNTRFIATLAAGVLAGAAYKPTRAEDARLYTSTSA